VPPLPKGLGTAITEAFGIAPSKRLGDMRAELERRCDAGEVDSHQDIDFYIAWMREHPAYFGL
jgi:poly(A) polymerase